MNNKFWAGLLALLGFSSCLPFGNNHREEVMMYGAPPVDFSVKGTVTDTAGEPIKDIRVVLRPANEEMYPYFVNDTVYTAADGSFMTARKYADIAQLSVTAVDVDGDENGLFLADEKVFDLFSDGDWSNENGTIVKTVDFRLEDDEEIPTK